MPKVKYECALYTIIGADGGLFRACRVDPRDGSVKPLPAPYGNKSERRWAVREASNALYRELCLGLRPQDSVVEHGLAPGFEIKSR